MQWKAICLLDRELNPFLVMVVVVEVVVVTRESVHHADEGSLHTLSADELYEAHLTPFLQQADADLSSKSQVVQDDKVMMTERINEQRAEIEQLLKGLEGALHDIEGSVEALDAASLADLAELKREVWEMEQEVAATR